MPKKSNQDKKKEVTVKLLEFYCRPTEMRRTNISDIDFLPHVAVFFFLVKKCIDKLSLYA